MDSAAAPNDRPMIVRQADRDIIAVRDALDIMVPAPVVLISGGAGTLDPLHAVRRHWRLLIIEGSRGAAEELLA
jgi:hypothetical protein